MIKITGRIIKILLLLFVTYDIYIFLFIDTPYKDTRHDVIELIPSAKFTPTETFKFDRTKSRKEYLEALKSKDALRITKRNGQYYWDSQGGVPLLMMTETRSAFKYTIFVAYDSSGVIEIQHDNSSRGFCHIYIAGYYREYRLQKREWLQGMTDFFPPKPEGWCELGSQFKEDKRISLISKYLIK
ncbi:MAG: hypothetical protein COB14_08845 [Alphaproteobacteria bacterium]|nr:MAG: hypothetical protein COB14_08845 [Alphaproteobacteria bacterium]